GAPPAAGEVDVLLALRVHRPWCEMEPLHELVVDENVHGGAATAVRRKTRIDLSLGRHGCESQTEQSSRRERRERLPVGHLPKTFFQNQPSACLHPILPRTAGLSRRRPPTSAMPPGLV